MNRAFNIDSITIEKYNNSGQEEKQDVIQYAGIKDTIMTFVGFINLDIERLNLIGIKLPYRFQITINFKEPFSTIQILDMVTDIQNMYNEKGHIYKSIKSIAEILHTKSIFQLEVEDDEDPSTTGES